MIFYFSGTGNSQLVAMQIATQLNDEIVSINKYLKKGENGVFLSKQPLVFVVPTYAWKIPKVVEKWLLQSQFEGNPKTYFILTCESSIGNATAYARKLCDKKKLHFHGLSFVAMPNNYVILSNTPNEADCKVILDNAKKHTSSLCAFIQKEEHLQDKHNSLIDKINSGPINTLYYPLLVHDKGFHVSNDCISCGKCAQRCPLNNISMKEKKPVWNGNCTHCMACIGGCPTKAIEYKTATKRRRRYYIMNERMEDHE